MGDRAKRVKAAKGLKTDLKKQGEVVYRMFRSSFGGVYGEQEGGESSFGAEVGNGGLIVVGHHESGINRNDS